MLETFTSEFEIKINIVNLTIGNGQSLELWASTNLVSGAEGELKVSMLILYRPIFFKNINYQTYYCTWCVRDV